MAIANALGSNVQNVFLALAVPWLMKCYSSGQPYAVNAAGISLGVSWMAGTLVICFGMAAYGKWKYEKWQGYMLVALYLVYLAINCFL